MNPQANPELRFEAVFHAIGSHGLAELPPPLKIEPVEYRRHPYSNTARVRIHHAGGAITAYVKILRLKSGSADHLDAMRRRVVNEFEAAAVVYRGFAGESEPAAVWPLGCLPEHLASVTAEAPGEPLVHLLEREAAWHPSRERLAALRSVHAKIGAWVRRFQALKPSTGTVCRDEMTEYLDIRLKRLVRHPRARFSEADRTRLLEYCEAKCRQVRDEDLREVWTHADFGPSNVLVHDGQVTVLDFAMAREGMVLNDVARMYTQLEWFAAKPKFRLGTIRALQQALLAGFDPQLTVDAPLFKVMVLQHRINHFLGVVERNDGVLSKIYNWHLARRDRAWVRGKATELAASGTA